MLLLFSQHAITVTWEQPEWGTYRASTKQKLEITKHNLRKHSWARRRRHHHICQPEILQRTDKRAPVSGIRQGISPEHPLNRGTISFNQLYQYSPLLPINLKYSSTQIDKNSHSNNHQALKQHRQSRLPPRKTTIEQPDPRHDEPHDECTADDVDIVEFKSFILWIDVDLCGIAAFGRGCVVDGLYITQVSWDICMAFILWGTG